MDNPQILRTADGLPGEEDPYDQIVNTIYTLIQVSFGSFIMSMIYFSANYIYNYIRRSLTCQITISGSEAIYKIVLDYLIFKGLLNFSMTHSKCQLKKKSFTWWWQTSKEETQKPQVEYIPSAGNHFFIFKNKKIWASTSEGETLITGWEKKPTKMEYLTLLTNG